MEGRGHLIFLLLSSLNHILSYLSLSDNNHIIPFCTVIVMIYDKQNESFLYFCSLCLFVFVKGSSSMRWSKMNFMLVKLVIFRSEADHNRSHNIAGFVGVANKYIMIALLIAHN